MICNFLSFLYSKIASTAKSLASHINSNDKFQSGAVIMGADVNFFLILSNAARHASSKIKITSLANKPQRGLVILEKVLYKSSIEISMSKKISNVSNRTR